MGNYSLHAQSQRVEGLRGCRVTESGGPQRMQSHREWRVSEGAESQRVDSTSEGAESQRVKGVESTPEGAALYFSLQYYSILGQRVALICPIPLRYSPHLPLCDSAPSEVLSTLCDSALMM